MVILPTYEFRLIAKNRGINGYLNMSREGLLSNLHKLDRINKNLSKYGHNKIMEMQNLLLNKLEIIERMNNLSPNNLKKIAEKRHIKNYNDMSKEDLIIVVIKSN